MINRHFPIFLFLSYALILSGCSFECTKVYIDNYSGRDISLVLDGKAWMDMKNNTSTVKYMEAGQYQILLYDLKDHERIGSMTVELIEKKKHVLNLMGGASYQSDKSILMPKGEIDLDKILGGGRILRDEFFVAEEDYVLDEIPENFSGLSHREADRKTYLRRMSREELNSSIYSEDDYWRREVNDNKMEGLSFTDKDKVYDIIRADSVCESVEELARLLDNDLSLLREKCPQTLTLQNGQSIEGWFIEKNRLIQLIMETLISGQLSEAAEKILKDYRDQNDFDGYFEALDEIDPQVNDLVAFQARYNRLKKVKATHPNEKQNLQIMENRLRNAMGFKPKKLMQNIPSI